jgi:hypothetical protein
MRSFEIPKYESQVIDWASEDVHRNADSPSWSPYSRGEQFQTVWAVEQAQGVIDNGGLQYFFENDWPENPPYALFIDAFRRIGAQQAADCIQDAVEMFPSKSPHLDYQMRRDYMDSLRAKEGDEESVVDKLGGRIIDLGGDTFIRLARYVLDHVDSFPTAKRNAEPGASPNGGPVTLLTKSGVTGGPPSAELKCSAGARHPGDLPSHV